MSKLPKLSQDQITAILEAAKADPRNPMLAQAASAVAELRQARKSLGKGAKARSTLTSSDTDEWNTPEHPVLDIVRAVGVIGVDPFWNSACVTHPIVGITKAENSLTRDWRDILKWCRETKGLGEWPLVYVNGPYSIAEAVAQKVVLEARNGCEVITLCKAATETAWFEHLCWRTARVVCFLRGRLHHVEAESEKSGPATFASALVYHGVRARRFAMAAHRHGRVIALNGGI